MYDDVNEGQEKMTTPFEDSMLESFVTVLIESGVQQGLVEHLETVFRAEKPTSADTLLQTFKEQSGDRAA
ncbi:MULTISPECIES: hypothetical protein [unclassified Leucobacter]|uniref:hypothetical protein n=1 Tax=unclassified Leucobacter TaxID=2621730 RepID=UPI00301661A1